MKWLPRRRAWCSVRIRVVKLGKIRVKYAARQFYFGGRPFLVLTSMFNLLFLILLPSSVFSVLRLPLRYPHNKIWHGCAYVIALMSKSPCARHKSRAEPSIIRRSAGQSQGPGARRAG